MFLLGSRVGIFNQNKKIELRKQESDVAFEIQKKFNISYISANILAARDFKADDKLKHFLYPTLKDGLPNPKNMMGLEKASDLIIEAINNNEKIAICSDFDVDGLTSASQLINLFNDLNIDVKNYVPDRFSEGYGLNERMIEQAKDEGVTLLLSLDYGTTNRKEIEFARKNGIKTIVIDHHHVGENNPNADVFVNPKQKGCGFSEYELCTAGLVWYLIILLRKKLKEQNSNIHIDPKDYLDLSAIGTICDMVPLIGPNRVIAKKGIEEINLSKRVGIIALKNALNLNKEINCYDISFNIGPRLNAAGRMLTGDIVVELLTTHDEKRAKKIVEKLDRLNKERQTIEEKVKQESIKQIDSLDCLKFGFCCWHPSFHTGVVGIVAQRLVEKYYKPSVVLGLDNDGMFKGSVRGIAGFSVIECLTSLSKYLEKFGGHEMAGGVSVKRENIKIFSEEFSKFCERKLQTIDYIPKVIADTKILLEDLTKDIVDEFNLFSPFGMANPNVQLLCENLLVKKTYVLRDAHLKVVLSDSSDKIISGIIWKQVEHPMLKEGKKVDIVFKPQVNSFGGFDEIQANISAVRISKEI